MSTTLQAKSHTHVGQIKKLRLATTLPKTLVTGREAPLWHPDAATRALYPDDIDFDIVSTGE